MVKQNWDIRGTVVVSLALWVGMGLPAQAQVVEAASVPKAAGQAEPVAGVAVNELAANAPSQYTVKAGDTLWGISGMFLKSPWLWAEIWGMNRAAIQNPHLIYPGQVLYLVKEGDRARLSSAPTNGSVNATSSATTGDLSDALPLKTLSPSIRTLESTEKAIPTLRLSHVAPFLVEPILVDELTLSKAPRLVAIQDGRVIAGKGDRVYALSSGGALSVAKASADSRMMRVVRNATPLKLAGTDEVLGYEAQYIARVRLLSAETKALPLDATASSLDVPDLIPATFEVVYSKEEIRLGDRLIPEVPFELRHNVPKAPDQKVAARVLSVHGGNFSNASQNQVLSINRGARDGMAAGDVLTFLSLGDRLVDRTNGSAKELRLPNERKGWAMVFRVFEKVSYVLVLEASDAINIGDYLVNPN